VADSVVNQACHSNRYGDDDRGSAPFLRRRRDGDIETGLRNGESPVLYSICITVQPFRYRIPEGANDMVDRERELL
jgi:hypothetical protein